MVGMSKTELKRPEKTKIDSCRLFLSRMLWMLPEEHLARLQRLAEYLYVYRTDDEGGAC